MHHWPIPDPRLSHFRFCYQVLGARGQWAAHPHRHALISAHLRRPAVEGPKAIRSPHTSSASAHTWTAPGARPRPPADTSVVGHACSGARPSGQALPGAGGKLGRTRAGLGALRRSPASAEPQRPLVLLPRLAPAAPSPAFSLSLPLSPDPSPALPPADRSFSQNPGGAQVSRWDVPVAREGRGCGGARCAHEHLGRLSSHRV